MEKYIMLGYLPLSNNLCESPIEQAERFPLEVMLCEDCGLSQLSIVVDPVLLFGHYVYRSSINAGYVKHCRAMAKELKNIYSLTRDSFMIDIAGNDGALLREFKDEIGLNILNVDPAVNLGAICHANGIPTLSEFWGVDAAKKVLKLGQNRSKSSEDSVDQRADLITATNVFAHVDDVYDFLQGIYFALKPKGVCVLEFPYLIDFIKNNEFDTIYFEHLSYFSIRPLARLCSKIGLNIIMVEKKEIHGGSVRVHITKADYNPPKFVKDFMKKNEYALIHEDYERFAANARNTIRQFRDNIHKLTGEGYKVAGFAASAKGNTLLNCAGITCGSMGYIVDETPEKIGMYSPGTHIPIVSMIELKQNPPDYLVILSWNFKDEIMAKCREAGYTGLFIIPIPEFRIVDSVHLKIRL